jgi:hypothetical protein
MRAWIALGLVAATTLALTGCQPSPEDRVVGNWQGDLKLSEVPTIPLPGAQKRVEDAITGMQIKISRDKKFTLSGGLQGATDGEWTVEERTVTMKTANQTLTGEISEDGQTMKLTLPLPAIKLVIGLRKTG